MHLHLLRFLTTDTLLHLDVLDTESLMNEACLILLTVTVYLSQLVKLDAHCFWCTSFILEPQPRLVWFGAT